MEKKDLAICAKKGFHMRFENGWTISVQFGPGNYCDNYDEPFDINNERKISYMCNNAEVWCLAPGGKNYPDEPLSHQTPEQILELMNKISKKDFHNSD